MNSSKLTTFIGAKSGFSGDVLGDEDRIDLCPDLRDRDATGGGPQACGTSGFPEEMEATGKILMACWGVVIAFWIVSGFFVKRTKARQPLLQRLIYLLVAAVAVLLLINGSARSTNWNRAVLPHTLAVGIVADVLALAGVSIAIWARATLGANWSARVTLKENHELIQRGPYRLVRHPIYSGLLLLILGTAILAGRVGAFIALVICFCGLWVKLRQEERLLGQHLHGYVEYMHRTKSLVPFIL